MVLPSLMYLTLIPAGAWHVNMFFLVLAEADMLALDTGDLMECVCLVYFI